MRMLISAAPFGVAGGAPAIGHRAKCGLGVGKQSLLGGDLARLQQRRLLVRLELENLLVESGGLWIEALARQVVGDARVLRDAFVELIGADVEVAERVGAVPVARLGLDDLHVLGNGGVNLAEAEGLLRRFQRGVTIERRHQQTSLSSVSKSVGGRNDRR